MDNINKFLPSKKFLHSLLIIIIILVLFFVIKGIISLFKNKKLSTDDKKTGIEMTVGTVIQKDSNNNGIPDWEEYLWGLDPHKHGPENKEFILSKKRTLEQSGAIISPDDSKSITENELLSRQFFATIISLQQTGNLNEENLNSISEAIGQEVKALEFNDIFTAEMLKIRQDSKENDIFYFLEFDKIFTKYEKQDIGTELTLISQGLVYNNPQALYAAQTIAVLYKSLAEELININAPSSIAITHLSLVNNYYKIGRVIDELTKGLVDPIIGMKAMLSYKKYTDAMAIDLEKLSEILQ